jgi:hypothetical protein
MRDAAVGGLSDITHRTASFALKWANASAHYTRQDMAQVRCSLQHESPNLRPTALLPICQLLTHGCAT